MFWQKLIRRQQLPNRDGALDESENNTNLDRYLTLPALIFLNVSNSIGSGIYLFSLQKYFFTNCYSYYNLTKGIYVLAGIASNKFAGLIHY